MQNSKNTKSQIHRENLQNSKRKMNHHLQWNPIRLTADFLSDTMGIRRQWDNVFNVKKTKTKTAYQESHTQKNYL